MWTHLMEELEIKRERCKDFKKKQKLWLQMLNKILLASYDNDSDHYRIIGLSVMKVLTKKPFLIWI